MNLPAQLVTASPESWETTQTGLVGTAGPYSDLFIDPLADRRIQNAPTLLFQVEGDFLLEAEVSPDFAATFDAGILLLWQDEHSWAKLCFEFTPEAQPMVVSVVTQGFSDDCNGTIISRNRVHLRIGKRGPGCVFHYSEDGTYWHLVRKFRMADKPLHAGFLVQSPTGQGLRADFSNIRFRHETLGDVRSGL